MISRAVPASTVDVRAVDVATELQILAFHERRKAVGQTPAAVGR